MKLIDTHSHIDMIEDIDIESVIENALQNGVKKIVLPAADEKSFANIINISSTHENVYAALGVHPESASDWRDEICDVIFSYKDKIIAIGEVGLDYYWDKTHVDAQKHMFIKQIELANRLELPLLVHDREAHKETYDLLVEHNKGSDVIMHCFSGSVEFMHECVKKGFYIGIGGVVTFKNAIKMKEVAIECPLDKLVLETDAPYLAPVPYRGKTNQPAYVKLVAEEIANLRDTSVEEIAENTTANAERIFKF